jgi:tetratricopeptide (TPR) repeat protein
MRRFLSVVMTLVASPLVAPSSFAQTSDAPKKAAPSADDAKKIAQLLKQAAGADEAGNAEEAESLLRAALEIDASHVPTLVALGKLLCENDKTAEGLGLLYHALQVDSKDEPALLALVDALLTESQVAELSGDADEASADVARAREVLDKYAKTTDGASDEVTLRWVKVLLHDDATAKKAYELATGLVKRKPTVQDHHRALVDAATTAKEFDAALVFYGQTAMEPWLKAWFLAELYAARATYAFNHYGDDEKAVQDYLAADRSILDAARMNPAIFDSASERASFYRSWAGWVRFDRQKRTDEAWDLFMSAYGRDPTNKNAVEGLSWVAQRLYESGEMDKAREISRQLTMLVPDRADLWNNYGLVCRDSGQFEESFRAYRRAMALAPDDPRVVNDTALILLYHLHRDLDLCERWLVRAVDLARDAMEKAKADEDEGTLNEQRGVFGDACSNLAKLYAELGRKPESDERWQQLRSVAPERPELPENAGKQPPAPVPPAVVPQNPPPKNAPPANGNTPNAKPAGDGKGGQTPR